MFYILNLCEIIYWFIRVVPFNYSPHTDHMLYIKKHMSDYLCVWSTQAFPTWAGPGAILISQSRAGITFGFPPQSSKPQKIPTDMYPHVPLRSVTSLHVCCLPCSMLIWIPGVCYFFIFLKTINAFVNLIYRIPVLKLVHGSLPYSFSIFEGAALALQLPALSETFHFPDVIFQLWWQGSSVTPSIHIISKISSPNN